jgi:hypothetical protein
LCQDFPPQILQERQYQNVKKKQETAGKVVRRQDQDETKRQDKVKSRQDKTRQDKTRPKTRQRDIVRKEKTKTKRTRTELRTDIFASSRY